MNSNFGLATKVQALPGKHPQLVEVLREVTRLAFSVPGCLDYVVSTVPSEPGAVFITEFWDTQASQQSAFAMAGIHEAMVQFQALSHEVQQYELRPLTG